MTDLNLLNKIETIAANYISDATKSFDAYEMETGYKEILMLIWQNSNLIPNSKLKND